MTAQTPPLISGQNNGTAPLECLRLPFLLFGPRFIIDTIIELRDGTLRPPVRELVVEPFDDA